jgi:hypothetical protein
LTLEFTKTSGTETITLACNVSDLEEDYPEDGLDDHDDVDDHEDKEHDSEDEHDHEEENGEIGVNVIATFSKGGDASMVVHGTAWTERGFEITHVNQIPSGEYKGPKYADLDHELQLAMQDYVEER